MQGVLDVNLGVLAGRPRGYIYQDLMYIKIHLSWTLHVHDTCAPGPGVQGGCRDLVLHVRLCVCASVRRFGCETRLCGLGLRVYECRVSGSECVPRLAPGVLAT